MVWLVKSADVQQDKEYLILLQNFFGAKLPQIHLQYESSTDFLKKTNVKQKQKQKQKKTKKKPTRTNKHKESSPNTNTYNEQEIFPTPKPQIIDSVTPRGKRNENGTFDQSSKNLDQEDLLNLIEDRIKTGHLTPDQSRRLGSVIQQISPQTPSFSSPTRFNSSHTFSTPQFRTNTPLRHYSDNLHQQFVPSTTPNIKKPMPVYSPMTPTQHIKQTAFRSRQNSGTTPVSFYH